MDCAVPANCARMDAQLGELTWSLASHTCRVARTQPLPVRVVVHGKRAVITIPDALCHGSDVHGPTNEAHEQLLPTRRASMNRDILTRMRIRWAILERNRRPGDEQAPTGQSVHDFSYELRLAFTKLRVRKPSDVELHLTHDVLLLGEHDMASGWLNSFRVRSLCCYLMSCSKPCAMADCSNSSSLSHQ